MATKVMIMFPYGGYAKGDLRESLFWNLVEACCNALDNRKPLVILNKDTERRKNADAFLNDLEKTKLVDIYSVWSVDTCQMWLSGWGRIIDHYKELEGITRVVLLPGDIDAVRNRENRRKFFMDLEGFIALNNWDIIIGDFTTVGRFNAKELIDQYGTYALMANWFPEIAKTTLKLPLNRPRSEFLNIRLEVLETLLEQRKFAYEQTLNMLIHTWDVEKKDWRYKIHIHDLGDFSDDSSIRQYRECVNQIERTERMLKLLWRELNEPTDKVKYQEFIDQYQRLDQTSTAIRENSRTIIRNLLGVGLE